MSFIVSILRLVFCDRLFDREKRSKVIANGVLMLTIWCAALYFAVNKMMATNPDPYDTSAILPHVLLILAVIVLVVLVIKTFFGYAVWPLLKVIPANCFVIDYRCTFDQGVKTYTKAEVLLWRKSWNRAKEIYYIPLGIFQNSDMMFPKVKIRPITANPKVRDISFKVKLGFGGELNAEAIQRAIIYFGKINPCEWKLDDAVKGLAYEFAEAKSKQISEFYNPLDSKQQKEFEDLAGSFLNEKLEKTSLIVYSAKFSIN
jgi:hypothetical protein